MAPAVPFALLGVVQLTAVAAWIGLAGASALPRLRRRVTPAFVIGALAMATADALTAMRFGDVSSDALAWLRLVALLLLAVGALGGAAQSLVVPTPVGAGVAGLVVPLGARPAPAAAAGAAGAGAALAAWWRRSRPGADRLLGALLAAGFAGTAVAAALGDPARDSTVAALAVLAARAAATLAFVAALVQVTRTILLGKLVGAILAAVVVMAAGAVGFVGNGVADEVQHQQSQRLLQAADSLVKSLQPLATRATLYAEVAAQCPGQQQRCEQFLRLFSDHDYFAVLVTRRGSRVIAAHPTVPGNAALLQLTGNPTVRNRLHVGGAVGASTTPMLFNGAKPTVAVMAAVAGGTTDARVAPPFVAVYGIVLDDSYLRTALPGYDVSLVADGRVVASSLRGRARARIAAEASGARVDAADPSVSRVVAAEGTAPTAAFVAVTPQDNGDIRLATLAVSQPSNEALRAQRSVLQRLFLTTLLALFVVALLALALAHRIAEPVRRLTVAAGRVRRGDLEARSSVDSRDEVGSLSRAFDAMTESLRRLTADLRATAAQEAALRARLETVVESMTDGLVVTDDDYVVTVANPTAARLLGRPAEEILGRSLADVLRVDDSEGRSMLDPPPSRGLSDGDLVRSTGERLPVRFGVAPLGDGQGHVVVLSDRTREYEVERMKTEFLANVSHELRTPLTPIRGYAEILARHDDLPRERARSFLNEILTSTARMSRAVELLVDVAALEGGRVLPERAPVPVRTLVGERLDQWRSRYPQRAGDFKRQTAGRLPAVDIDSRWVSRALDELADNAVKYTPPGAPIVLGAALTDDGSHVRVAVRDGGPGFDPRRAGELVEDFSQADASETRRVGGLGLGLGFVSRVAERFDLPFSVDTVLGKGSEFALTLPVASAAATPRSAGSRARTPTGVRRGR